jgi:aminoglycoside phosphotransferase (APT) family kinase protein
MDPHRHLPAQEVIQTALDAFAPGNAADVVRPIQGDFTNPSYILEAHSADGKRTRFFIKHYAEFGEDRAAKVRLEYKTLALLQEHGMPVPKPLYLDDAGTLFGSPSIVTSYVPGKQISLHPNPPADPIRWANVLAMMLARIHSIPCDAQTQDFLLDANSEVVWFLHSGDVPKYMNADPDGEFVWNIVHDQLPNLQPAPSTLVHIDYWPGNILWHRGRIAAVIDWEEAAYGDPGIDVAYCRMDMFLSGMSWVAEEFLKAYEVKMGQTVANLGFWELAAIARPMFTPAGWITESPAREGFRQFIDDAKRRSGI